MILQLQLQLATVVAANGPPPPPHPPSIAGLPLSVADIQPQLTRRRPGQSMLTTARDEADEVTILSGVERGGTLGTPVALLIPNTNTRPGDYASMAAVPRPGHADYTYMVKYGRGAASGGGRASARETAARVAAGAVAETWLAREYGTRIVSYVASVGHIELPRAHATAPGGRPWSREEVDAGGTLLLLRQVVSDRVGDEAAFVAAYRTAIAREPPADDGDADGGGYGRRGEPVYQAAQDGTLYDALGRAVGVAADVVVVVPPALPPPAAASLLPRLDVAARRSGERVEVRCPHTPTAAAMATLIRVVKGEADSVGGTAVTVASRVPVGLGEPVFDKLEARLAAAMLSLPATKGFEMGDGFAGTRLRGSVHNDVFVCGAVADGGGGGGGGTAGGGSGGGALPCAPLLPATNHAGGTLGGISSGANLRFRVAVKPVSTIGIPQATAAYDGHDATLAARGRHDSCVLPRTPPLFEAMTALVLADAALLQRTRAPPVVIMPAPDHAAAAAVAPSVAGCKRTAASAGLPAADDSAASAAPV